MTGRPVSGLLLALVLATAAACSSGQPAPRPSPSFGADTGAAAFAEAYADFRADFDAAAALGEQDGLDNDTTAVRAVRAAYADLAEATRAIDLPVEVTADVEAMLTAIDELVTVLGHQASASTSAQFRRRQPGSSDALQQADDAIQVVVDALGIENDPGGTATPGQPTDPTYLSDGAVTDADAWVRDLLEIGARNADHRTPSEDMGVVSAWRAAFPEILGESNVVDHERLAPRSGISGFAVLPTDGQNPASRSNPYYLAFAVRDASGACSGGVLSGYPEPTARRHVELAPQRRCSGAAVAASAGY